MTSDKKLRFLKVTLLHLDDLLELRVASAERALIAPTSDWLAEAAHLPFAFSFGIFAADHPVGLVSVIDPRLIDDDDDVSHYQPDCLYLWRLMVDHRHRGSGYGTAAVTFVGDLARCLGTSGVSLTTMDREPGNALDFYLRIGFTPTGRRLHEEIELMLTVA